MLTKCRRRPQRRVDSLRRAPRARLFARTACRGQDGRDEAPSARSATRCPPADGIKIKARLVEGGGELAWEPGPAQPQLSCGLRIIGVRPASSGYPGESAPEARLLNSGLRHFADAISNWRSSAPPRLTGAPKPARLRHVKKKTPSEHVGLVSRRPRADQVGRFSRRQPARGLHR